MKPTLLIAAAALLFSGTALAHPGGHGALPAHDPPAEEEPAKSDIPADYAGLVAAIGAQVAATETALKAHKIADLYASCDRLTELANAVEGAVGALPEEAQATAKAKATHLAARAAVVKTSATEADVPKATAALAEVRADFDALGALD